MESTSKLDTEEKEAVYKLSPAVAEGMGIYSYFNGDEYRGFFQHGKYHGFGRLKEARKNFILQGKWVNGKLLSIDKMTFSDGLVCKATLDEQFNLDMTEWSYCTEDDRRYESEKDGNPQVSERPLAEGHYDIGKGIYDPSTETIFKQRWPMPPFANMFCNSEKAWIFENCRRGLPPGYKAEWPEFELYEKIVNANLSAMPNQDEQTFECPCKFSNAANFELRCKAKDFPEAAKEESVFEEFQPQELECTPRIPHEPQANSRSDGPSTCRTSDASISHDILPLKHKRKRSGRSSNEGRLTIQRTSEIQRKTSDNKISNLCEDLQDLIIVQKIPCGPKSVAERKPQPERKPICKRSFLSERKSCRTKTNYLSK